MFFYDTRDLNDTVLARLVKHQPLLQSQPLLPMIPYHQHMIRYTGFLIQIGFLMIITSELGFLSPFEVCSRDKYNFQRKSSTCRKCNLQGFLNSVLLGLLKRFIMILYIFLPCTNIDHRFIQVMMKEILGLISVMFA